MRLRGRSAGATAEVGLRVDPAVCRPGDTVTVHVTARPTADAPDAELAVVLRHVQRFSEGAGETAHVDDWEVAGEYVFRGAVRAGQDVTGTVALPVPRRTTPPDGPEDCRDERYRSSADGDDADDEDDDPYDVWIDDEERWGAPTGEGPGAATSWRVEAGLVVGVEEVGTAGVDLVVLAPPGPAPAAAPQRRAGKDVRAVFSGLPTASLPAGAAVAGRVWLTAQREVAARRVRVELVRQVRGTDGEPAARPVFHDEVVAGADVAAGVTLPAGPPREFAFGLALPPLTPPSVAASRFAVRWLLRVTVDRPWRADDVWEQELAVHSAR